MPSRDIIHRATVVALKKDGWEITADPLTVRYDDLTVYADLAAEHTLGAQRGGRRIAVEAKSFVGSSLIRELEMAVGQFAVYRALLNKVDPDRELWLAAPHEIVDQLLRRPAFKLIVAHCRLSLLAIDQRIEEVQRWIR
jgi:hypothetical protein